MIDASSSIELEEFERVEAAPRTTLLRISARTSLRRTVHALTLTVDNGGRLEHLSPLPAPPDPSGLLRVAYSAPTALLQGSPQFTLGLPNGTALRLPAPRRRQRSVPRDRSAVRAPQRRAIDQLGARLSAEPERRVELEARVLRASAERAAALARVAELEAQQLQESQAQAELRAQLERETSALAKLDRVLSDRDAAVAQRDLALDQVRQRLGQADQALAEQRARAAAELEQAGDDAALLEGELADAQEQRLQEALEELALTSDRLKELQSAHGQLQAGLESLVLERGLLVAARVDAEAAFARLGEEHQRAQAEARRRELEQQQQLIAPADEAAARVADQDASSERAEERQTRLADLLQQLALIQAARVDAEHSSRELQQELLEARDQLSQAQASMRLAQAE